MSVAAPEHVVDASGPTLFARYAYPPNELGLCGPSDHRAVLEYADAMVVDDGLRDLARGFTGAWPYLELIAAVNQIADPLDARVVDAYWLGNAMAQRVRAEDVARHTRARFGSMAGRSHDSIAMAASCGLPPTHGFHVFCVYPWIGLLRDGRDQPGLHVLDRCRIRWGEVIEVDGATAVVRSPRLIRRGGGLALSEPVAEHATLGCDGLGLAHGVTPGDHVSLHWDWVCDRLSTSRLRRLRATTMADLRVANRVLAGPVLDRIG